MDGFRRSLAVVIGINQYAGDIPPLRSAVGDATDLARTLADDHGYEVQLLTDLQASLAALDRLLGETLPSQVGPDDRRALDMLARFGDRADDGEHSPFARALLSGLRGEADLVIPTRDGPPIGDGVITAIELYSYLRDRVETGALAQHQRQTPGLWE